jgi:uncharacterized sulfatase
MIKDLSFSILAAPLFSGSRLMTRAGFGLAVGLILLAYSHVTIRAADRPNILWITCEDISPNLGCYGDKYAVTPNLDRLASQGVRFTHAFAPIGVCAPSRSCLITGMYPPAIGTHHMRCQGKLPPEVRCFPQYLREAGYYCTNNVKTDYNFAPPRGSWDESSNQAHYRNRKSGQPFFAVFNFTSCHESQIRLGEGAYQKRTAEFTAAMRHDPAKALVPPYHPDAPEVRRDWARYADMITYMDGEAGRVLKQLEDDGLAEQTIVFFFSDHGAGMPRSKRWLYDSSTRVPCIVRCPRQFRDLVKPIAEASPPAAEQAYVNVGGTSSRLVSFVDFAPTMLALCGVKPPEHLQGQAFLGSPAAERQYVYGFRDRMDERYDMLRSVRDKRYKYVRNYLPHLPWFHHQHVSYMYQMPTMRVWQRLADEGKLSGEPAVFMATSKPVEELYDTQVDPYEVRNLATSPEHKETLERLRAAHHKWREETIDLGLLPEGDLRTRFVGEPEYTAVRRKPELFPFKRIAAAADLAGQRDPKNVTRLVGMLADPDAAVRYWACVGLAGLAGDDAGRARADAPQSTSALLAALHDKAGSVQVAAADALCFFGRSDEKAVTALGAALKHESPWVRLQAVNVLDRVDEDARPVLAGLEKATSDSNEYVVRVAQHAVAELNEKRGKDKR